MKTNEFKQIARKVAVAGAFSALALGFVLPTGALAASTQGASCAASDVQCVITLGDKLIAERETALSKLGTRITNLQQKQHITAAEADSLLNNVNGNKSALETIKTKLDSETTAKAAREDIRSVFTSYRIFAVVLPRDARTLHLDVERTLHDKLKDAEPKIQAAIAKASGDDKAKLEQLFDNYQQEVNAAENQIDLAQSDLPSLTVDIYNSDRSTFTARLKALTTAEAQAHVDLHKAALDLHQMVQLTKIDPKVARNHV